MCKDQVVWLRGFCLWYHFLYILLYNYPCNVGGWSTTLFHPTIIPSTSIVSYIYPLVIVRSDIRRSYGTSHTTVISSIKNEAHNLNPTVASAAPRDDPFLRP